jgi:hypothetical protein
MKVQKYVLVRRALVYFGRTKINLLDLVRLKPWVISRTKSVKYVLVRRVF